MMNTKQKKRFYITLGILLGSILVAALIVLALKENIHLYYTPTEIAQNKAPANRPIRLGGIVVPGTIQRDANSLNVSFDLTDGASEVTVHYTGILPDLFREGQGIVATGQLDNQQKLTATQVLAKHDENYMPKEVQTNMQVMYHDS